MLYPSRPLHVARCLSRRVLGVAATTLRAWLQDTDAEIRAIHRADP